MNSLAGKPWLSATISSGRGDSYRARRARTAGLEEALLSADDGGSGGLQLPLDGAERHAFRQHQDKLGAKDVAHWQRARLSNAAEFQPLVAGKGDCAAWRRTNLSA